MIITLLLFLFLAIVFSFLCSMWESVLLSITPSYTQLQQQNNTDVGQKLKRFKQNIDQPLSAILTLNTIAHTVGAIGVGEQAASIWHDTHPFVTSLVVPAVMTIAILVLSEIIPKTLGANYWKELTPFTVRCLTVLIKVLWPAVWLSERMTRLMRKNREGSVFSRSEFLALTEIGAKQGIIEQKESHLIASMLKFSSIQVQYVTTPRVVVKSASEEMTVKAYIEANKEVCFSRIPVFEEDNEEKVVGYVRRDEILMTMVNKDSEKKLKDIKREILVVLKNFPITALLDTFLEKREHIALVVDEFGGMNGIVTIEDLIETLLGLEIVDELDNAEDMQKMARNQWEKRAREIGII